MNFYEHLDASTLLHWTVEDSVSCMRATIAMSRIHDYLTGARSQMQRMWVELEQAHNGGDDWSAAQRQAFVDMHFYFVAWDAIGKMMRVVVDSSGFDSAQRVYERHSKTIERYRSARHHLEHFDERLPGGRRAKRLSMPGDLGNLSGNTYSFGGETWDIGPASLEKLTAIVEEFEREIREEGIERHRLKFNSDT